ncbi:hypothetical protein JKP88DRAFT_169920 [Tribonema minus]|uniref:DNA topoisomerase I n=1 Tax=Tribonema minus TaxID=303371 RepID=A0A836C9X0_9STRA|nr:hypothetical protein JKP88DRAFT_169920 [Tribonema minus]
MPAPSACPSACGTPAPQTIYLLSQGHTAQPPPVPLPPRAPLLPLPLLPLPLVLQAYKWWEEPPLAPGRQWSHLEHNGMSFPDEYEPHGVPLMYDGEEMELSPEDEEIATFFADVPLDGPQLGDAATAKVFSANFFSDWKESMPTGHPLKNAKFDKCDFGAMRAHLQQRRLIKKAATDGERAAAKAEKERRFHLFGLAIVDGHLEKVGNFIMEPPGLFRGRGKHPKTGKLKKRAYPSEVTVNIGEEAKVPQCPVPGFAWGNVQHDPGVAWLSTWKENINNMNKYAMLSASSSFKGKSDMEKYNKAMRLKGHIDAIRRNYERGLNASTSEMRQLATAMWLIDKLALRVGGEKGEDEADTVGCCTLRVEHMTFGPAGTREMELEFLGKDSMLFKQNIDFTAYGDIGSKVFDNLTAFCKGRKPAEQVFQKIDPTTLNKHLQSLMPGLSAKVFRTYNASETLQQQLPSADALKNMTVQAKVVEYNNANREVAILCNHQRTVSGAMLKSFENLGERVAKVKEQRADLKAWLKLAKDGKAKKIPLKGRGSSQDADDDEEKKELTQRKFEGSHMFANTPSEEQLQRKIEGWTTKLKKMEVDLRDKEQNKEVSLGTSKINYMDPRISVAWCKRNEVPIERIFAKTLRDKFVWAMNVPPDWRFDFETLRAVTAESSDEPKAVTAVADDADAKAKGKGDDDEEEEEEEEEEMD